MNGAAESMLRESTPQESSARDVSENAGYIGRIPVRNLWLLMLYASDLFRQLEASGDRSFEDSPDDLPDLVAEILAHEVERRLRRNLSYGYQFRHEVLGRVRGRIDLLHTEAHQLLQRGVVACRFDELTIDTPRNRYVRSALEVVSKFVRSKELAHRCRSLVGSLRRQGVVGERPGREETSVERFGRNDAVDRKMVDAARLAFEMAIPTEKAGSRHLPFPDRDINWIRRLFEKGVAGFYDVVLTSQSWNVQPGTRIHWPKEGRSPRIDQILPTMRTDIVLDHVDENRRIVIDTKFNSVLSRGWYRNEAIRSGYMYQIYAYLRTQEESGDSLDKNAEGMFLHPSVGEMFNEWVDIQGHRIHFKTVDLAADTQTIRSQLLDVIQHPHPQRTPHEPN